MPCMTDWSTINADIFLPLWSFVSLGSAIIAVSAVDVGEVVPTEIDSGEIGVSEVGSAEVSSPSTLSPLLVE